jgi:hypothetical protein
MAPGQLPKFKPFLPQVHGVLYLVNKEDMRKLQKHEGGYNLTELEVSTQQQQRAPSSSDSSLDGSRHSQLHLKHAQQHRYMVVDVSGCGTSGSKSRTCPIVVLTITLQLLTRTVWPAHVLRAG